MTAALSNYSYVEQDYHAKIAFVLSPYLKKQNQPLQTVIELVASYAMPLIRDLVMNPWQLLADGPLFEWGYRQINECRCSELARLGKYGIVRHQLESALVAAIVKKHPNKDEELVVASLGSGRTFSELRLLALLIEQRYRRLKLVVADKRYEKEPVIAEDMKRFIDKEFCAHCPELTITTEVLTSYESYLQNSLSQRPTVLLMLDLKDQQGSIKTILEELIKDPMNHNMILGFTRTSKMKFSIAYCSTVLQEYMMLGLDDHESQTGAVQLGLYTLRNHTRVFTSFNV